MAPRAAPRMADVSAEAVASAESVGKAKVVASAESVGKAKVVGSAAPAGRAEGVDLGRRRSLQMGGLAIAFLWAATSGTARAFGNARRQPGDAAAAIADGNATFAPNAFVRIDGDGAVRLVMPAVEMGQGIYTGASMMLAEELDVGMDQITVEHSPPND